MERRARGGHDGTSAPLHGVQRDQRPQRAPPSQSAAAAPPVSANRRARRGARALAGPAGAWPAARVRGAGAPGRGARPESRSGVGGTLCGSHSLTHSLARTVCRPVRSAAGVSHVGSVRGAQRGCALRDALGPLVPDAGGGVHRGARPAGHPRKGRALQPAEPAHLPGRVRAGAAAGTVGSPGGTGQRLLPTRRPQGAGGHGLSSVVKYL